MSDVRADTGAMASNYSPRTDPAAVPGPGDEPHPDPRAELSEFLRTRRARLLPADMGLTGFGGRRRVPGLRREELAQLAGVSVAYYTRLEQGKARNVSVEVLDAISRVLGLSDTEHDHLLHLAKPKKQKRRPVPQRQQVRPVLLELLTAVEGVPAYVWGRRTDVLAWNRTASALFGDWAARAPQDRNWARITFLDPAARQLFVDWESKASDVVGQLRLDAGLHPRDPQLTALVGELSMKSEEFRTLWAAHDVRRKSHGSMRLMHPLTGEMTVRYETFTLPGDQEQSLSTYHAEPGSASEESLRLVSSWGADASRNRSATTRD